MPSFDVVSEIDLHELTNAVDQANREITNRFDFKGTNARVEQTERSLLLEAESEFQVRQMRDILETKMTRRNLDLRSLEGDGIVETGGRARLTLTARHGIDTDSAKQIQKLIKQSKLKVQASIQDVQVRVTGKKRDDLQSVIAMLKGEDLELPLQFTNFRD
jgi:uncharacterized protein YajQ (UPF0234 family)